MKILWRFFLLPITDWHLGGGVIPMNISPSPQNLPFTSNSLPSEFYPKFFVFFKGVA